MNLSEVTAIICSAYASTEMDTKIVSGHVHDMLDNGCSRQEIADYLFSSLNFPMAEELDLQVAEEVAWKLWRTE